MGLARNLSKFKPSSDGLVGAEDIDGALPATVGGTGLTSPGTSGNILVSNGTTWQSTAPSGSADLQEFAASGTYTKPSGATFVMVETWGAGGGGGGGAKRTNTSDTAAGGAGGPGFCRVYTW